jgi:3-methyladenine DNA glycosylase AlkD
MLRPLSGWLSAGRESPMKKATKKKATKKKATKKKATKKKATKKKATKKKATKKNAARGRLSARAKEIAAELSAGELRFGNLKKLGKEIKKDHALGVELWSTGGYRSRLLAALIFDKKQITESMIEELAEDLLAHDDDERNRISEWLLANQLTKDAKLAKLVETWAEHASPTLRRLFWYYQARLRWTGKTMPGSADLLAVLEARMATEEPEVQWTMNFCAGWIGVFEPALRSRCVRLGKKLGLYEHEVVPKNCTPSYLPEFIRIEAGKRS